MKLLKNGLLMMLCLVLVAGCDSEAAKDAAGKAKDAAGKMTGDAKDKMGDMAGKAMDNLKVGDVNIGSSVNEAFSTMKTKLAEVKDVDSAKAALPAFEAVSGKLDMLTGLTGKLPETAKSALSGLVKNGMGPIKEKITSVLAMAGVGDVLKPILDGIVQKLTKLAG